MKLTDYLDRQVVYNNEDSTIWIKKNDNDLFIISIEGPVLKKNPRTDDPFINELGEWLTDAINEKFIREGDEKLLLARERGEYKR